MDVRTDRRTMQQAGVSNPRSTAQIAGHPLHPMLIPFPVACFVLTLVCDIFYFSVGNTTWVLAYTTSIRRLKLLWQRTKNVKHVFWPVEIKD